MYNDVIFLLEYFAEAHSTAIKQSIEDYCFLYLILTVALATALGVTIILVSYYTIVTYQLNQLNQPIA